MSLFDEIDPGEGEATEPFETAHIKPVEWLNPDNFPYEYKFLIHTINNSIISTINEIVDKLNKWGE